MKNLYLLLVLTSLIFSACSSEDLESDLVGGWILEKIRVEGPNCQSIFGAGGAFRIYS